MLTSLRDLPGKAELLNSEEEMRIPPANKKILQKEMLSSFVSKAKAISQNLLNLWIISTQLRIHADGTTGRQSAADGP